MILDTRMMIAYDGWGSGSSIAGLVSFGGGWLDPGGGDICNYTTFGIGYSKFWKLTLKILMV